jgi:allantoin racemase
LRILILNPNTTEAVTTRMVEGGRAVASAGTELVPMTATKGVPYISTRAEAQIGGAIALEMLAEMHTSVDAAVIAAYGDPGLLAAKELFDIPVIGASEAAMLTACMLGQRFAIVTFATLLIGWYRDCLELHGLAGRCAGIFALDQAFGSIDEVQDRNGEGLVDFANSVLKDNAADSLIFAGAPLAGMARKVRHRIPVPMIDPIAAAVKQAEALVALAPRKAIAGSFQRPAPKPTIGLPPLLGARIEHKDMQGAHP